MESVYDIEVLLRQLGDPDPLVRTVAAKALKNRADQASVGILCDGFRGAGKRVRYRITVALLKVGAAAIEPLAERLRDTDSDVRWCVAKTLGRIGGEAVMASLIRALHDPEPKVRLAAQSGLERVGPSAILTSFRGLRDSNEHIREGSALVLAGIGTVAVPMLIDALQDPSPEVRSAAASVLQTMEYREPIPHRILVLKELDSQQRHRLLETFQRLRYAESIWSYSYTPVTDIRAYCESLLSDHRARNGAKQVLEFMGVSAAVPPTKKPLVPTQKPPPKTWKWLRRQRR
jgi:HEAT repeat protein